MKTRIHVNQHNIKHNSKHEDKLSVLTVKDYKQNRKCNSLDFVDNGGNVIATLVYQPEDPLSCGAKVWIETDSKNIKINV